MQAGTAVQKHSFILFLNPSSTRRRSADSAAARQAKQTKQSFDL